MKTKINYLLVLVLASFVFAGCASTHESHESKQWEYKIVGASSVDEIKINDLGKEGWQLVSAVPSSFQGYSDNNQQQHFNLNGAYYIFKRPLHSN